MDVPLQKRHKYAVRRSRATGSFSGGTGLDLLCINQCIRIAARHAALRRLQFLQHSRNNTAIKFKIVKYKDH